MNHHAESSSRLDSWKEIAGYLRRGVTTAQRWESEFGLPVHRHRKGGGVYAFSNEIDDWMLQSKEAGHPNDLDAPKAKPILRHGVTWIVALALIALVGGITLRQRSDLEPHGTGSIPEQRPLVQEGSFARYPSFSPDGSAIAFIRVLEGGETALFTKALPAGRPQRISAPGESIVAPRWSPKGDWIVYSKKTGPLERAITILNLVSGESRVLFKIDHGRLTGEYVGWTPDASGIVYSAQPDPGDPLHIERFDLATKVVTRMSDPDPGTEGDYYPNVSPNGSYLAFSRCFYADGYCIPYVRDISRGSEWPLAIKSDTIRGLAWTPDSSALVVAARLGGPLRLWMFQVKDGEIDLAPRRLTNQIEKAYHPVLRPGGDSREFRIAYEHQVADHNIWRLDLMSPDAQPEPVVEIVGHENQPSISPDGRWLSFIANGSGSKEVWLAQGDGTDARQVTNFEGRYAGTTDWSSDSESLLVRGHPSSGPSMRIYDRSTLSFREISARGRHPTWSTEGTTIYGDDDENGGREIVLFNYETGEAQQLTFDGGYYAKPGPFGQYFYFTKAANFPLGLWRAPIEGGKPEMVLDRVRGTEWDVADDAIYYMDAANGGGEIRSPIRIRRYLPKSGRDELVRKLEKKPLGVERGFAVTADRRWAYWSQRDRVQSNLIALTVRP